MANTIKKSQVEALSRAASALWARAQKAQLDAKTEKFADCRRAYNANAKADYAARIEVLNIIELITTDIFQVVEG